MSDREEILKLWVKTESEALGRQLEEGVDYDVKRQVDKIIVSYHSPEMPVETFEITDTPAQY